MRQLTTALAAVGVLALLGAAGASGDSTTKCFGKQATIVGSGLITGTSGDDVIVGSAGDDEIDGGDGNDRICGLEGNDILMGGLGDFFGHGPILSTCVGLGCWAIWPV
jgi:Ca2+-binding RTX toxin-like protein